MPFVLNTKKGSVIRHPSVGELPGGIAKPITTNEANQLKHIRDVVVFDAVMEEENTKKEEKIEEPTPELNIKENGKDKEKV